MKRMDRMMAIVMALQQRAETAQSLADKLEVSKRTVLRDVQALSELGVPLVAVSGPGGGYRLMEGYHLPPLQLTAEEALTLLMALDGMAKYSDGPFREARWTASDKIRSVLPQQTMEQVEPLLAHIGLEVPDRRAETPHLQALMNYAAEGAWVRAAYRSQKYRRELDLCPSRVYAAHGFWYCEAYSVQHGETRTFRVDRFEEPRKIPPPDLRYDGKGERKIRLANPNPTPEPESKPQPQQDPLRIVAKLTYRGALLAEQDPDMGHLVRQTADEEWMVDFECPGSEWHWAIGFFFQIGLDAEVLEPEMLRDALKERAEALAARYVT